MYLVKWVWLILKLCVVKVMGTHFLINIHEIGFYLFLCAARCYRDVVSAKYDSVPGIN